MTRAGHLVRRFAGSLHPRALDAADLDLVHEVLQPAELACWERLGRADRAESLATARAAIEALGADPDPDYIAAALLHDVGKAATRFGVFGRSWATAAATVAGTRRARAWSGAIGQYVNHDELGAARLEEAGARPVAVLWARAHHRRALWPEAGIPPAVCALLARADGESYRE